MTTAPTIGVLDIVGESMQWLPGYTPSYFDPHTSIPSRNPERLDRLRPEFHGVGAGVPASFHSMGVRGAERTPRKAPIFCVLTKGEVFGSEGATCPDAMEPFIDPRHCPQSAVPRLTLPGSYTREWSIRFMFRYRNARCAHGSVRAMVR